MSQSQHGFIRRRSVLTNNLRYLRYVHDALDKDSKTATRAFYADFAEASDKGPRHVLLKKLENFGFLRILENYSKDRKHFVRIENIRSSTMNITSGVPQGSIIGPLMYCIFKNDLPEIFKNYILLFADDLKFITTTTALVKILPGSEAPWKMEQGQWDELRLRLEQLSTVPW